MSLPTTASTGVRGLKTARSSTTSNETFRNPASAALSRARSIAATDRSIPTTCPADPISLAVRNETSPTPHPQSSTLIPGLIPARSITSSVISPRSRDWLAKRRSSHSASPKTYSWRGAAGSFSIPNGRWLKREFCCFISLNRRGLLSVTKAAWSWSFRNFVPTHAFTRCAPTKGQESPVFVSV